MVEIPTLCRHKSITVMKTIQIKNDTPKRLIRFERIKPFKNICKVTGVEEKCNVVVEYIPNDKVVDIVDYRRFFERGFNELIEDIAMIVYDEIMASVAPRYLKVTVFLEGNPQLTDWSCTIESDKQ